jgi:hypothetical protein
MVTTTDEFSKPTGDNELYLHDSPVLNGKTYLMKRDAFKSLGIRFRLRTSLSDRLSDVVSFLRTQGEMQEFFESSRKSWDMGHLMPGRIGFDGKHRFLLPYMNDPVMVSFKKAADKYTVLQKEKVGMDDIEDDLIRLTSFVHNAIKLDSKWYTDKEWHMVTDAIERKSGTAVQQAVLLQYLIEFSFRYVSITRVRGNIVEHGGAVLFYNYSKNESLIGRPHTWLEISVEAVDEKNNKISYKYLADPVNNIVLAGSHWKNSPYGPVVSVSGETTIRIE